MTKRVVVIEDVEAGKISDGYHTFEELYAHRCHLFTALMKSHPDISWRAKQHDDGSMYEGGWFLAGMDLPTGQVSYHLPIWMWPWLDNSGIKTLDRAPRWDGHTPADVLERLHSWCMVGESAWPVG